MINKKLIRSYGNHKSFSYGYIGNMHLKINRDRLVIHGSIAKFLNQENCTPLKRTDVERSIHKLEDEIGIKLNNAIVTYVEFGPSIIVNENPGRYLDLFGWPPRLGKTTESSETESIKTDFLFSGQKATVTYRSKTGYQEFIVYNKIKEMEGKRAKNKIPPNFKGKNVFRLEYKIKNPHGIKDKFGRKLTLYDLFDENVYKKFQLLFLEFYNSIEKYGRTVFVHNVTTPKEFIETFFERQRQLHPDEYNDFHREVIDSGKISSTTLSRIRSGDKKRSEDLQKSDTSPLIAELDEKVKDAMFPDN